MKINLSTQGKNYSKYRLYEKIKFGKMYLYSDLNENSFDIN